MNVVVRLDELVTFTGPTLTPAPLTVTVVTPGTRFVPVSVTVTAVLTAPPVGVIASKVGGGGKIVKVSPLLKPPSVAIVTARSPRAAPESIVKAVVNVEELVTLTVPSTTPGPLTDTRVAPGTKFVPVSVKLTVVPVTPIAGDTELKVGRAGRIVKYPPLLDRPPALTRRVRGPSEAAASIVNVAASLVVPETVTEPTATPPPVIVTFVPPGTKFVPLRVTITDVPTEPVAGEMELKVGDATDKTENGRPLLTPLAVVTVTSRSPKAAPELIVRTAIRLVVLETFTEPTVTASPLTVTVVAPGTKSLPVNATFTVVPMNPAEGASEVRTGTA